MLRWTKLGGGPKESASSPSTTAANQGGQPQVGSDGLTDVERQALEDMDRFYGMENVSLISQGSVEGSEGGVTTREGPKSRPTQSKDELTADPSQLPPVLQLASI